MVNKKTECPIKKRNEKRKKKNRRELTPTRFFFYEKSGINAPKTLKNAKMERKFY